MSPISGHTEHGYRTAIHIRDHKVIADELIQDGGTDTAPTPMEILLGTVGACIAVTTTAYAQRKAWPLEGVSVELEMQRIRSDEYPEYDGPAAFLHEVREHIGFEGRLNEDQRARLMTIAGKCPVHLLLENPVFFKSQLAEETLQP